MVNSPSKSLKSLAWRGCVRATEAAQSAPGEFKGATLHTRRISTVSTIIRDFKLYFNSGRIFITETRFLYFFALTKIWKIQEIQ